MRRHRLSCVIGAILGVGLFASWAPVQKRAPQGAKVLLLSGGARQHHGYRDQALYLAGMLEDTGRFQVTICEDAALYTSGALAKYDLVIAAADRRDPEFKLTLDQQRALTDWVKAGHGYVSIHGADNAPDDWTPELKAMLGGIFSHIGLPDGKTRKGKYKVHIAKPDHPIMKDIDDFEIEDELYYHIQMADGVEPLATVEFESQAWPVAWTREFGKGRVFHTPLGHRDFGPNKHDPLRTPGLGKMIVQGALWTVGKAP